VNSVLDLAEADAVGFSPPDWCAGLREFLGNAVS
jgi:hypothetical protein